jgi:hypothetical protein
VIRVGVVTKRVFANRIDIRKQRDNLSFDLVVAARKRLSDCVYVCV